MSGHSMSPEMSKAKRTLMQLQNDHTKLKESTSAEERASELREHIQKNEQEENLDKLEENPYLADPACCTIL